MKFADAHRQREDFHSRQSAYRIPFTKDGDNLKVSVSVKYLDNKSKMTQISQYDLVLHKDDNWKIVE